MLEFISACSISRKFQNGADEIKALDSINLAIKKGEHISIVGHSGSGKSTLLNVRGGLLRPTNGKMYINGISIGDLDEKELSEFRRENIGFVFQNYNLIPVLNTYENIVLPIKLSGKKVDKEYIDYLIEKLGLEKQITQMVDTLSGGQRQRVGIARALSTKPALVLADEPTGNLDSKMGEEIIQLMRNLARECEQTMVVVTHNDIVAKYGKRVVTMEDGKLVREEVL